MKGLRPHGPLRRHRTWIVFGCGASFFIAAALSSRAEDARAPVLLELFTSEGCSSCPPADQLLSKLDREQPVPGTDLIVISEHVDYWNNGGWNDPYSSAFFTQRQDRYDTLLNVDDPYTPQLIVDGSAQAVGSNWPKVEAAIEKARAARKVPISLEIGGSGSRRTLFAKVAPDLLDAPADLYLAFTADHTDSQVQGGENSGRHLAHVSVAYSVAKIGKAGAHTGISASCKIPARSHWGASTRIIVFLQDPKTGRILGAAQQKLLPVS